MVPLQLGGAWHLPYHHSSDFLGFCENNKKGLRENYNSPEETAQDSAMRDLQTRPGPKVLLDKNTDSMLLRIKGFRGRCLESLETTISSNGILVSSLEALCQESPAWPHTAGLPLREDDTPQSHVSQGSWALYYYLSPLGTQKTCSRWQIIDYR